MIIFNVGAFGNFDMPYTVAMMKAPDFMSKQDAIDLAKITKEMFKNSNDVKRAIEFLKSKGCKFVEHISITVGGNL